MPQTQKGADTSARPRWDNDGYAPVSGHVGYDSLAVSLYPVCPASRREEEAVPGSQRGPFAAGYQGPRSSGDQKGVEGIPAANGLEGPVTAVHGEIGALPQVGTEGGRLRRSEAGDIQGLVHMEGTGLPVGTGPVVVEDPVGNVGILLNLRDDQSGADGVKRPGGDDL